MKKAVIPALGLFMLIASAATTNAASQIDCSGLHGCGNDRYRIEPQMESPWRAKCFTNTYGQHRLEISLIFRPVDELLFHWLVRVPGYKRFGKVNYSDDDQGRASMVADFAFGQMRLDWNLIIVGRLGGYLSAYDLVSLGYYMPKSIPGFTNLGSFDRTVEYSDSGFGCEWESGRFCSVPDMLNWTATTRWPWRNFDTAIRDNDGYLILAPPRHNFSCFRKNLNFSLEDAWPGILQPDERVSCPSIVLRSVRIPAALIK